MNRTTSSHLARSVASDHWDDADRERMRRTSDAETRHDAGHLVALTAWAARLERALSVMSRRPAGDRAHD
jgi:hypothetical protein